MKEAKELRYEDATPKLVTVERWACCECGFEHHDERMARWCCATSMPCKCGGRTSKHYTFCDNCRSKQGLAEWLALEFAPWDGEFPVGEWNGDEFHWDEDDLREASCDAAESDELTYEMIADFCDSHRVCKCVREPLPKFEVENFLCDHLPDECDMTREQVERIDLAVNAILAAEQFPAAWTHIKRRIDPRAIAAALGVEVPGEKGGA